jgi:hypothetical protein
MPFNDLHYRGGWNAATNSPQLRSRAGEGGDLYLVTVGGSTALGSETGWGTGDIVLFTGDDWIKIPYAAVKQVALANIYNVAGVNRFLNTDGTTALEIQDAPISDEYIKMVSGIAGGGPAISVDGTADDIQFAISSKGQGPLVLGNGYGYALQIGYGGLQQITKNVLMVTGGPIQSPVRVYLISHGGDTDIDCEFRSAGLGQYKMYRLNVHDTLTLGGKIVRVVATGFSYTVPDNLYTNVIFNPAGTIATGQVQMPSAPTDGQVMGFSTLQTITTFTVNPNAGQTVVGAPGTLTAVAPVQFLWEASLNTWVRI